MDDKSDALDEYSGYPPIISSVEDYLVQSDDVFTCAIGDPAYKKYYIELILNKGGSFISLISPRAIVRRNSKIGNGCIITHYSNVSVDTKIGDYVSILGSGIGHDASIGNFSVLSGRVNINGFVQFGNEVYLASGTSVAPHKKLGDGAYIGIGSVVISNIKAGTRVFGNPAKKMDF